MGMKKGDTFTLKETDITWICRECKEKMPQRRKEFDGYCKKCYK